jgi:DNA-directed RNA polymerase subunit K/omega
VRARSTRTTTTSARGRSTSSQPPMVDSASKNYLTIALEEVAAGKIKYQYR